MKLKHRILLSAASLIACGLVVGAPALSATQAQQPSTHTASTSILNANEIADLQFMREEEKLAHDVYLALYQKWNLQAFRIV